jgi:transcriptional regulator with XRE-family HTH domain
MDTKFKRAPVDVPDNKTNGAIIRTLRTEADMPQGVLAEAISIHPSYLSDLERGNRGFSEELFNKAKEAIAAFRKK